MPWAWWARPLSHSGRYLGTGGPRERMPWALLQYRCAGPFGWHLGGIHRRGGFELRKHDRNQNMTFCNWHKSNSFRTAHLEGTVLPHCLLLTSPAVFRGCRGVRAGAAAQLRDEVCCFLLGAGLWGTPGASRRLFGSILDLRGGGWS